MRCCRSTPRCKTCPIVLQRELREVRELVRAGPAAGLPAQLAALPACLHKYAPLLERQRPAEEARHPTLAAGAEAVWRRCAGF